MPVRPLPRTPDRKPAIGSRLVTGALLILASAGVQADIRTFEALAEHAEALAGKPYSAPETGMPPSLRDLDYDAYRDIRFRPARSIWRDTDLPVEIQLLHLGMYYQTPVALNLITGVW